MTGSTSEAQYTYEVVTVYEFTDGYLKVDAECEA